MDIKKKIFDVILGILAYSIIGIGAACVARAIYEYDYYLGALCFFWLCLFMVFIFMGQEEADNKHPNLCSIMTGMIINLSWIIFPDIYSDFKEIYSVESLHLTVMILILSLTVQFIVGNDKEITAGARTYFTSNLLLVIYCLYLSA